MSCCLSLSKQSEHVWRIYINFMFFQSRSGVIYASVSSAPRISACRSPVKNSQDTVVYSDVRVCQRDWKTWIEINQEKKGWICITVTWKASYRSISKILFNIMLVSENIRCYCTLFMHLRCIMNLGISLISICYVVISFLFATYKKIMVVL